jgi:hypothetical protein
VSEEASLERHICVTCGSQHAASSEPPAGCAICLDERQYVGPGGQRWTTLAALQSAHEARVENAEAGLTAVGLEPAFAIGQRALLVEGLLWDCVPLLEGLAEEIEARGGIEAIAISHPHYYTTMVEWAERFDARILIHEADREWVMCPSERIEHWSGDRYRVSDSLELICLGGHFAGGTVCHWQGGAGGRGALLSGDIIQSVSDRDWVSFMWSFPNLIPLPPAEVERIRGIITTLEFDRLYGAWWEAVIPNDARAKVLRSADRYLDAVTRGRTQDNRGQTP